MPSPSKPPIFDPTRWKPVIVELELLITPISASSIPSKVDEAPAGIDVLIEPFAANVISRLQMPSEAAVPGAHTLVA